MTCWPTEEPKPMMPKAPQVRDVGVPDRSQTEIQNAAAQERARLAGDSATFNWLTGGTGAKTKGANYSAAKLLGGG